MPLIKTTLNNSLSVFSDKDSPLFISNPENSSDNAIKWADAIETYASSIIPASTSISAAKSAFINVMSGLVDPVPELPYSYRPFTAGYFSPERKLSAFNTFLTVDLGFKIDHRLDKASVFAITNRIRDAYNKKFPQRELTEFDIMYNQSMYNEQNSQAILMGRLKPLQVDGIIGDETILYKPIRTFNTFQSYDFSTGLNKDKRDFKKEYKRRIVAQPATSGDLAYASYVDGVISKTATSFKSYLDGVKEGIAIDYTQLPSILTQSDVGGYRDYLGHSQPISYFKGIYTQNHSRHDPLWKNLGFDSIAAYEAYRLKDLVAYKAKPPINKDGITLLQTALAAFAVSLSAGMQPAFTAVPPPSPIVLSPVSVLGLGGATPSQCTNLISTLIDSWFRTGTAINNSTSASILWS